ncbi:hypothetical protein SH449x_004105 [Pirellulaceae bacterium SH449]
MGAFRIVFGGGATLDNQESILELLNQIIATKDGIVVLPVLSSVDRRAIDGVIELFVGETQPVTINVFDANHNPVNIEALELLLRIESTDRSFVVEYPQSELVVSENAVAFVPTAELTEKATQYRFGLRSLPNKTRIASGKVDVRYAP